MARSTASPPTSRGHVSGRRRAKGPLRRAFSVSACWCGPAFLGCLQAASAFDLLRCRAEEVGMSFVSRGFRRRHTEPGQEGRVPPGQYVTRDFPVLSAGPTPHAAGELELRDHGRGRRAAALDLGRVPGAAAREHHGRHPLRDQVVEARHGVGGRLGRHAARRRRDARRVRGRLLRRRLHDQPAARRTSPAARRGSRSATTASRSSPSTAAPRGCSCRTSTSGRARSGCAVSAAREDEPGFWESSATTTAGTRGASSGTRATDLAARRGRRRRRARRRA